MPRRKCESCDGTGRWTIGNASGECVDCHGKGFRTKADEAPSRDDVLRELHQWFRGEVDAGDEALTYWVERIESVLPRRTPALREP